MTSISGPSNSTHEVQRTTSREKLETLILELSNDRTKLSNIINEIKERKQNVSSTNSQFSSTNMTNANFKEGGEQKINIEPELSLSCLNNDKKDPNSRYQNVSIVSWDFDCQPDEESEYFQAPIDIVEQEKCLVEDMLNILLGFDGIYIKANPIRHPSERRTFRINGEIQQQLIQMAERMLPVASDYSEVARFVEISTNLSAGRVNQALGSIFSYELTDYMNLLVSLEQVKYLDLSFIWTNLYRVTNKLHMMAQICSFITKENTRGGSTLSILHQCTSNCLSDPDAQKISFQWTRCASEPFFESLEVWLYQGEIFDPYDEFMITTKTNRQPLEEDDWENKFQLRKQYTPQFLEDLSTIILNTGIYMFCISKSLSCHPRLCFSDVTITLRNFIGPIEYSAIDYTYLNSIKRAHDGVNEILRQLFDIDVRDFSIDGFFSKNIEQNNHTLRKLEFAKSVFCIQYGDMFYNIYENCFKVLNMPAKKEEYFSLTQLVKKSIEKSSIVAEDNVNFCSDIDVVLERGTLSWQVNSLLNAMSQKDTDEEQTVLETMSLRLNACWPMKMILDRKAMKFYQMIFRHIFYMKYVHKRLCSTQMVGSKRKHALKYSMIIFLQTCLTYMTVDTVESTWEIFQTNYFNSSSVLDLVKEHKKYIYDVLTGCMLTSAEMFKQLRLVLDICLKFSEHQNPNCKEKFNDSLSNVLILANNDSRWTSFTRTLLPIFSNYLEISKVMKIPYDQFSITASERSLEGTD